MLSIRSYPRSTYFRILLRSVLANTKTFIPPIVLFWLILWLFEQHTPNGTEFIACKKENTKKVQSHRTHNSFFYVAKQRCRIFIAVFIRVLLFFYVRLQMRQYERCHSKATSNAMKYRNSDGKKSETRQFVRLALLEKEAISLSANLR